MTAKPACPFRGLTRAHWLRVNSCLIGEVPILRSRYCINTSRLFFSSVCVTLQLQGQGIWNVRQKQCIDNPDEERSHVDNLQQPNAPP